jgi:protein TonB
MRAYLSLRDEWFARAASVLLHAALLWALALAARPGQRPATVIFTVETVTGIIPQGEGSGAEGASDRVSDLPANANPLAGGLDLKSSDKPLPAPAANKEKPAATRAQAAAPSLDEVAKRYENLGLGLKPREGGEAAGDLSEGGMGNARKAGVEGGALGLQGPIAGRGYRAGDYSFGRPLPEESEVVLLVTVGAKGEVLKASIHRTSGYPELDQHALSKAREIAFDPLPPGAPQEEATGSVTFRFEYTGRAKQ